MSEAAAGRWVRLQDAGPFVGDLWSRFDKRQRREILASALLSGTVSMRARYAAKPRHPDGRPMLPHLERDGVLGMTTPLPNVQVFLRMDPRLVTWDFCAGRVVICPIYDDKRLWGPFDFEPHFPGGTTIATGRFLSMELDDIEFDGAAARAYIVENLLPNNVTLSDDGAVNPRPLDSAAPPGEGNAIPFPNRTGLAGRPSSWDLMTAECRRRYEAGERQPNDRIGTESPSKWARVLIDWLKASCEGAPVPKPKTLTNKLGALLRELAAGAPPPTC